MLVCRQVLGVTLPALGIFRERTIANLANTIRKARVEQRNGAAKTGKARQASFKRYHNKPNLPAPTSSNAQWLRKRPAEMEMAQGPSFRPGRLSVPQAPHHAHGDSWPSFPESQALGSTSSGIELLPNAR